MADQTYHPRALLRPLGPADETITLRYRNTDQFIRTRRSVYYRGLQTRFRNWQLAGPAAGLAPPVCLSQLIAGSARYRPS